MTTETTIKLNFEECTCCGRDLHARDLHEGATTCGWCRAGFTTTDGELIASVWASADGQINIAVSGPEQLNDGAVYETIFDAYMAVRSGDLGELPNLQRAIGGYVETAPADRTPLVTWGETLRRYEADEAQPASVVAELVALAKK